MLVPPKPSFSVSNSTKEIPAKPALSAIVPMMVGSFVCGMPPLMNDGLLTPSPVNAPITTKSSNCPAQRITSSAIRELFSLIVRAMLDKNAGAGRLPMTLSITSFIGQG